MSVVKFTYIFFRSQLIPVHHNRLLRVIRCEEHLLARLSMYISVRYPSTNGNRVMDNQDQESLMFSIAMVYDERMLSSHLPARSFDYRVASTSSRTAPCHPVWLENSPLGENGKREVLPEEEPTNDSVSARKTTGSPWNTRTKIT